MGHAEGTGFTAGLLLALGVMARAFMGSETEASKGSEA
jgi:hypothetical protein